MPREITFENKESIITKEVPRKNKCTAEDLNEIKEVVNENAQNLVTVSSTEPTGNNKNKVWFKKGKNLFNENSVTKGYAINSDGNGGASSVTNTSGFIKVRAGKYTLSYDYSSLANQTSRGYCFFDNNLTYISGSTYDPSNRTTTFTIANDGYIRFSFDKNCTNIQFEQGQTATTYEASIEQKIYTKNNNGVYEEFNQDEVTISSVEPSEKNNKVWFKKGKNLFNIVQMLENIGLTLPYTTEKNGITFTFQRDGGIKVQGTASSNVQYYVFGSYSNTTEIDFPIDLKNGIKYTSSGGASDWSSGCQFVMYDYDGTNRRGIEFKNTSLTMNKEGYKPTAFSCNVQSGTTINTTYYLQIEQGQTATSYEAPVEPEIYTKNSNEVYEKFVQKNSKLLWKNANPTNDFAPQAITLNTDDYENLEIYYKQGKNSSMVMSSKTLKGYGTRLSLPSVNSSYTGGATYQRTANYTNDTTYNIGDCSVQQGNNVATDNSAIIPILILGYK